MSEIINEAVAAIDESIAHHVVGIDALYDEIDRLYRVIADIDRVSAAMREAREFLVRGL